MRPASISAVVVAALLSAGADAHVGPCTVAIARVELQIRHSTTNPLEGPTAPQTVAAQLNRQPTPATVQKAERKAGELIAAALERARKANAVGNAAACTEALKEVRDLYGIS